MKTILSILVSLALVAAVLFGIYFVSGIADWDQSYRRKRIEEIVYSTHKISTDQRIADLEYARALIKKSAQPEVFGRYKSSIESELSRLRSEPQDK